MVDNKRPGRRESKLQITKNEKPPFVVIREVMADKRIISGSAKGSEKVGKRESGSSHFPLLTFPPASSTRPRRIGISLCRLELYGAGENRFKYKLEGLDGDWVEAGERHTAFYNNVPPGSYTFRVIACNNDGVWNPLGSSVKLSLQPHPWQTLWFKIFVLLASFSGVGVAVRYATRKRLQFRLERLEHQHAIEKERTRIAQDMHDDLGARLTEIMFLSGLAENSKDGGAKFNVAHIGHPRARVGAKSGWDRLGGRSAE